MPMNCTACAAAIEATPDTDVATLRAESQRLTAALTTAQAQAEGHAALVASNEQLTVQLATRNERDARITTMREAGADPAHLDDLQRSWEAAQVGKADADRQDFATYLTETAKTHPLYQAAFAPAGAAPPPAAGSPAGASPAPTGQRPAAPAAPVVPAPPSITAVMQSLGNAQPASPTEQKYGRADVKAYVGSTQFDALDKATKLAQLDQMEASLTTWESSAGSPAQY